MPRNPMQDIREAMQNPDPGRTEDANDGSDLRAVEHKDADKVRDGELSAAQLDGGGATVNPEFPDAQYPPGIVETAATGRALLPEGENPADHVPEKHRKGTAESTVETDITV